MRRVAACDRRPIPEGFRCRIGFPHEEGESIPSVKEALQRTKSTTTTRQDPEQQPGRAPRQDTGEKDTRSRSRPPRKPSTVSPDLPTRRGQRLRVFFLAPARLLDRPVTLPEPTTVKPRSRRHGYTCVAPLQSCVQHRGAKASTAAGGERELTSSGLGCAAELDSWVSHLSQCKQLTEMDVKRLCEKVGPSSPVDQCRPRR